MMFRTIAITLLLVAMTMTLCQGQGQDSTVIERAYGTPVVDAVIDRIHSRCVFPEDRLFLRRVAYVMSRDGASTSTYRPGFDGGIWQVNETMLDATKACNNLYIQKACRIITSEFGIDWQRVTWSDLRKPLYSGLAAALYTLLTVRGQSMPGSIGDQATTWARMYGEDRNTFSSVAAAATSVVCDDKLDLVFILDSSGSVSQSDFGLMTSFAADVVDVMDVSPEAVRIADIVYSSSVLVYFDFDDYSNKADVRRALRGTTKIDSGTSTHLALDQAAITLYDPSSGARPEAKKVAVLVTDGQSNLPLANASALALKRLGTTVFAIGVGSYDLTELRAVASDSVCSHVLTLTSFDQIQSILTEIQKSTCQANHKFTVHKPITGNLTASGNETHVTVTGETPVPTNTSGNAIVANAPCGILDIYVSTTDSKPGPAVFDERYHAMPSRPAVLSITERMPEGTVLYVTVVGTKLPQAAALRNCTDYSWSLGVMPKENITKLCEENGGSCSGTGTSTGTGGPGDTGQLCDNIDIRDYPIDNPCSQESLHNGVMRHSYPYDPTKFLQCDMHGRYFLTACPGAVIFNEQSLECGFTSPGSAPPPEVQESDDESTADNSPAPLPDTVANPCTRLALLDNRFFHKFDLNETKFVQCDQWGKAWLMPCRFGSLWSQDRYTCVKKATRSATSGP